MVAAAAALACTPLANAQNSGSSSGSGIYWNVKNESPVDLVLAHNEQGSVAVNLDGRTTVDTVLGTSLGRLRRTGEGPGGGGGGGGVVAGGGGGGTGIVGSHGGANTLGFGTTLGGGHGGSGGDPRRSAIDLAVPQTNAAASEHSAAGNVPSPGGCLVIAIATLGIARRRSRGA